MSLKTAEERHARFTRDVKAFRLAVRGKDLRAIGKEIGMGAIWISHNLTQLMREMGHRDEEGARGPETQADLKCYRSNRLRKNREYWSEQVTLLVAKREAEITELRQHYAHQQWQPVLEMASSATPDALGIFSLVPIPVGILIELKREREKGSIFGLTTFTACGNKEEVIRVVEVLCDFPYTRVHAPETFTHWRQVPEIPSPLRRSLRYLHARLGRTAGARVREELA